MSYLCSRKTRAAFCDAANQVKGEVIALLQLMESMFELGFLDVSDMRWRTPIKTFTEQEGMRWKYDIIWGAV